MTPYILLGHYDDRCAATKRQNPRVVIIMQKQVDHCGSVPRGDECVISGIWSAFSPVELIAFETRWI